MRIGGPVFTKSKDPGEIVEEHKKIGYRAAIINSDNLTIEKTDQIREYRKAFAESDITIAEVGAWCNMLDPREEVANKNIEYVSERLALADEIGAKCCVNILGTYETKNWYGPHYKNFTQDFFDKSVEVARKIIDTVKPKRAKLSFEMMPFNLLDTPENYLRFIKAIDRPEVGVHLDPVNCISSPRTYYNNSQIINDCFIYLGPYILSCHAKDIWLDPEPFSTILEEVRPGLGNVNYKTYLSNINKLNTDLPLIIEHLADSEEYKKAFNYITEVADQEGLEY